MTPPLSPQLFELDPNVLWVMHCGEGPIPRYTADAVRGVLARELRPWTLRWKEDVIDAAQATRAEAARLVGGRVEDITLTPTTSSGLVAIAQGLRFQPGDEVLAPLGEFSTNSWPWLALQARGVKLRTVELWDGQLAGQDAWRSTAPEAGVRLEQRLLDEIGPQTKLVTASWVRFQDGLVLDLQRLARGCEAHGVPLVVDGIQGAGTLPVPLEGISAFATGGHKGLLAPAGLGLLWTDETFRLSLVPQGSWLSVEGASDFNRSNTDLQRDWSRDGTRLEQGGYDLVSGTALHASLKLLNTTGVPKIRDHIQALQRRLLDGLAGVEAWRDEARRLRELLDEGRIGSILSLWHGSRGPAGLQQIFDAGMKRGIFASIREGYLRIALHGFHTERDVERLVAWLADASWPLPG